MSAYITQSQLQAYVQDDMLTLGLDDDADDAVDDGLFATILAAVQLEIDGMLGAVYSVPFSGTIPSFIQHTALVLCANTIWQRRGAGDSNPFIDAAKTVRDRLGRLARREEKLDIAEPPGVSSGDLITDPSMTYDPQGRLMI